MMQQDFATAFARVRKLVADFQQHGKAYLSSAYSEQDVRKDFIDKFWIALGWDVNHEQQTNPYEQDVKVEKNVDVKGRKKKADYAFLAANFRAVRFFVEAKKPARNIDNADDYFQTIRYGWNAQTALSVLTDFEQFRVLDCRYKPDVQTALNRALKKFHYTEYADADKFREIYYLFAREAVLAGSLEKYAASLPKPTGKAKQRGLSGGSYKSVDDDFLAELDDLRDELARSFKLRNPQLNGEELTEATQRTIDRLVFMRFLEDKLIEPDAIVEKLGERGPAWADFVSESQRLNRIYNGIIFKPHAIIDAADFVVDERVFAGVRERLAHTNSPYDFNSLPVHILGSIYERFLGKVSTTTDKRAKVVDKPEVRKAGGVYYTPAYIVRYIVAQTIGQLIAGKTPEQIAGLRFADIACGSGSFLLGVYDELLRYHTAYYNEPEQRKRATKAGCIENADGALRLSLRQRRDILLKNIYGVDLDAQAVEVAQLSLFLKLLEDETTASAKGHQLEFRETMLPALDQNIVHGNSLIGWDINAGNLFGDEEERRLFPLDFEQAFPEVMRGGGFDAIVGNPPYVFARDKGFSPHEKKYFSQKFKHNAYQLNSFLLFTEQGFNLLKEEGQLGFIIPNNWLTINTMKGFRDFIIGMTGNVHIVNNKFKVFPGANVDTSIIVFSKTKSEFIYLSESPAPNDFTNETKVEADKVLSSPLIQFRLHGNAATQDLMGKSESAAVALENFALIKAGLMAYEVGKGKPKQTDAMKKNRVYHANQRVDSTYRVYLDGKDVKRYELGWSGEYLKYGANLAAPRDPVLFEGVRILVRQIPSRPPYSINAMIVTGEELNDRNSMIVKVTGQLSEKYILAILNSRLITFWFDHKFDKFQRGIFPQFKVNELAAFPIRTINLSDKADRARHDRMVSLVEAMLAAKRQLHQTRTDRARHHYEAKCAALDRQLDALVYELYELTPAEIALVEGQDA